MGRPSTYTPEIADAICERLAAGESLRAICREAGMPPHPTVLLWVDRDIDGLADRYARARAIGLDVMADELLEISDEEPGTLDNGATDSGRVAHHKLQVDTRKWLMAKLAPKRYGERTAMELTGANGGPVAITDTDAAAKLAGLLALAKARKDIADLL